MPRILSRQERLKVATQAVAVPPPSVPAPVHGWNTRDALSAMDPLDAIQLDNWYPDASGVNLRNGYVSYATGMGSGTVKTLAEYNAGATRKFLAAASGAIYDVSASGAVGAALGTGFTSDEWQTEQFLSKLFFCNGADTMQVFDGSSLGDSTFTGVTLSTLWGVKQYQQRLFFWQKNSTSFWYAPLNSINGALASYDLSPFSPGGGNLINITTYSHDGGAGVADFIVFIMSSGWALIFFGNDPSLSTSWEQIGRYRIAAPVNIRAVCNYGAEAFVTTFDDHVALSAEMEALVAGRLPPRSKISPSVAAAVTGNPDAFGWQALYYTKGRRLIFNVPNADGSFSQHVQNTAISYIDATAERVVSPWCRFTGMNASCWGLFKDNLYFGGADGVVYQADTGALDVLGAVQGTVQQAWTNFNQPQRKRLTDIRPLIQSYGNLDYTLSVGFDYGDLDLSDSISVISQGSPWDTSPWDTSPWSPEFQVSTAWRGAGGDGVAAGWGILVSATNAVTWLSTDFRGEMGNAL